MNEHRTPEQQAELDAAFMALAVEEARAAADAGEVPIGAVVVHEPMDRATRRPLAEPRVIARAHNRRETDRDPAGHAEFLAMKEAARVLDAWRLADCTVYVTLEPCLMCAGLMHQARVARCVYGAPDQKAGALGTLYRIHEDGRLNHQFEVMPGVAEGECAALLRDFFAARRARRSRAAAECEGPRTGAVPGATSQKDGASSNAVVRADDTAGNGAGDAAGDATGGAADDAASDVTTVAGPLSE